MASEIAGLGRLRAVAFVLSMVKLQESGLGEMQAARFRLPVLLSPAGDVSPSLASGLACVSNSCPLCSLCLPKPCIKVKSCWILVSVEAKGAGIQPFALT